MEQEFDLKTYLGIIRRRFLYFLVPIVVGCAVVLSFAYSLPAVYRASAKILVESQQIPGDMARSTVTSGVSERIEVIRQRLMTRTNLLQIVRDFNLFSSGDGGGSPSDIVELMRAATNIKRISVGGRNSGNRAIAFTVSFDYGDQNTASRVANQFVKLILEQNIKTRTGRASKTLQFFEQQVKRLDTDLVKIETTIIEFKSEHRASLPESIAFRRTLLTELQSRIPEIDQKIIVLETEKELLTSDRVVDSDGTTIASMRLQLAQLRARYSDRHPAVKRAKRRLAIREAASAEDADTPPPGAEAVPGGSAEEPAEPLSEEIVNKVAALDRQLNGLRARRTQELEKIATVETAILATPEVGLALNALERKHSALKTQLREAQAKMAQAAIGEQLEEDRQAERFEVIENATPPTQPLKPNRPRIILAGLFVSVAAGIGVVLLFEFLDRSIRSGLDLERRLQMRPLSTIPMVMTAADRRTRIKKIWIVLIGLAIVGCAVAGLMHVFYQPLDLIWIKVLQKVGL